MLDGISTHTLRENTAFYLSWFFDLFFNVDFLLDIPGRENLKFIDHLKRKYADINKILKFDWLDGDSNPRS